MPGYRHNKTHIDHLTSQKGHCKRFDDQDPLEYSTRELLWHFSCRDQVRNMESAVHRIPAKGLQPNELILTCTGLSFLNWDLLEEDFEFVGGHSLVCRVPSFMAEFLSPKVARLRKCDPFCSVYTFKSSELFPVFESFVSSLRFGRCLSVEESNFFELVRISQELENDVLLSSLLGMIDTDCLTVGEAILLFRAGIDLGTAFSARFGTLRDFIASRFYEIEKRILDTLDLETAQLLLSSPSLRIKDEDSLYNFIRSRSENDVRFTSLFEFIYFEYLSVNSIRDFVSFGNEKLLENINAGIWRQICGRLILDTQLKENPRTPNASCIEFVYDSSKPLEGIIAYLTRECHGNVHDEGVVNITSSSIYNDDKNYHPKNAASFETDTPFDSKDEQNAWICYEFKDCSVIPKSYSLRSFGADSGGYHLKSWVIEVSKDGISWTEIDRRDNDDLNGKYATANFTVAHVPSESYRFFRLKQVGQNHFRRPNYYLILSALEIFGVFSKKRSFK